jgi:hypothetical protein
MDDNWQFVEGLGDHNSGIVFESYEFLHANAMAAISNKARKERKRSVCIQQLVGNIDPTSSSAADDDQSKFVVFLRFTFDLYIKVHRIHYFIEFM